jgi:lysophospholipase L1-like esterase
MAKSASTAWLFRSIAMAGALCIGLVCGELALGWREKAMARSDRIDPGMLTHDDVLGWRLVPNWRGGHQHWDFVANYAINGLGFRADTDFSGLGTNRWIAVLGDSFTFGLGVNDESTFVGRLDQRRPGGTRFANFGVPGYSTDQELLLLEKRVLRLRPTGILLVVYLANDFFDNLMPFPLQFEWAKPRYALLASGLVLTNSPVPQARKDAFHHRLTLASLIFDEPTPRAGLRQRLAETALGRMLLEEQPAVLTPPKPGSTLQQATKLFQALLAESSRTLLQESVVLWVALLPGRSFVETPRSASARFQDYYRLRALDVCASHGIPVVDLALGLCQIQETRGTRLFYPHDGHLNRDGHQAVAELIESFVDRHSEGGPAGQP